MTKYRQRVLAFTIVAILAIAIYPPWVGRRPTVQGGEIRQAVGHHFLWSPPEDYEYWSHQVDFSRFGVFIGIPLALASLAILIGPSVSIGRASSSVYSPGDWAADMVVLHLNRASPPACLSCGRRGFFGPRHDGAARMYRLCKFCGFYQDVEGPVVSLMPTTHNCQSWPSLAGAPYIWWVRPGEASYVCEHCQGNVDVAGHKVPSPADTPQHPWWSVPQGLTYDQAVTFWTAEGRPGPHL